MLVVCDCDIAETEARKGFVVHGDHALASFREGGHGRVDGDVVSCRCAVGIVVCE